MNSSSANCSTLTRYQPLEAKLQGEPKITVPVILLHGADDNVSLLASSVGKERHYTDFYERIVPEKTGHFVPRENPEAVVEAVLQIAEMQIADAPPLELHYQVLGKYGALRRGSEMRGFDDLYKQFTAQTNQLKQAQFANRLDEFVREDASALFLCSRQALYAVNKEVSFTPYALTFELAECEASRNHWSRARQD